MVKNENYYVVHGWMLNKLGLKGTDLQVYAIIYGFSQAERQNFTGSAIYLAEWTGSTVRTIRNSINSLQSKGLLKIIKKDATHSEYHAIIPDFDMVKKIHHNGEKISSCNSEKFSPSMVKKFHHNGEKISPNNINNINKDIYKTDRQGINGCLSERKKHIPTLEEVIDYAQLQHLKIDPVKFYEKNQERGWITKQGQPIKRWKSLMWSWNDNEDSGKAAEAKSKYSFQQNEYDFDQLEKDLLKN